MCDWEGHESRWRMRLHPKSIQRRRHALERSGKAAISGAKNAHAHRSQQSRGRVVDRSALLKLVGCEERPNKHWREGEGAAHEKRRMNSAEHREERVRWGRASREIETACVRVIERDAEREGESRGGEEGVFMVVEKSGEAHASAPYRIGRTLNPGGQTPQLRL
jgi:hypothetical protein